MWRRQLDVREPAVRWRGHDIEAAATVDVDVEISGYENSITEIDQPGIARDFRGGARRERDDLTVFNHEQRVANLFDRSE